MIRGKVLPFGFPQCQAEGRNFYLPHPGEVGVWWKQNVKPQFDKAVKALFGLLNRQIYYLVNTPFISKMGWVLGRCYSVFKEPVASRPLTIPCLLYRFLFAIARGKQ